MARITTIKHPRASRVMDKIATDQIQAARALVEVEEEEVVAIAMEVVATEVVEEEEAKEVVDTVVEALEVVEEEEEDMEAIKPFIYFIEGLK